MYFCCQTQTLNLEWSWSVHFSPNDMTSRFTNEGKFKANPIKCLKIVPQCRVVHLSSCRECTVNQCETTHHNQHLPKAEADIALWGLSTQTHSVTPEQADPGAVYTCHRFMRPTTWRRDIRTSSNLVPGGEQQMPVCLAGVGNVSGADGRGGFISLGPRASCLRGNISSSINMPPQWCWRNPTDCEDTVRGYDYSSLALFWGNTDVKT